MTCRGKHVRSTLWVALLALVFQIPAVDAGAKAVEKLRYSTSGGRTRLVLDLDSRCEYTVSEHHNPARIAINVKEARAARNLRPTAVDNSVVNRVRVNRLSWGTQIVLDLARSAEWKHFSLSKSKNKPHRIVVDVFEPRTRAAGAAAHDGEPVVIAIDPGHGGKDPGATGRYGLVEKLLVLDIARRVAARIDKEPGFRAVLTRNRDVYLTLPARTRIAGRKGAEAFVSIHLNTAPNRSARGTEIYFLSPAGAAATASRVLAHPGRAARRLGLEGSNNSDLLHMLVDVNQQSVLARSEMLGESILDAFDRTGLPPARAIKQKSFSVLRTIDMPSVLVEVGFISNVNDAKLLKSSHGRDEVAAALADGIVSFFRAHPPQRGQEREVVIHRVQKGETLWKISRRYGTTIASLRRANKLGHGSVLRVGQELVVPGGF